MNRWKKVISACLTAAMIAPACLGSIGSMTAEASVALFDLSDNGTPEPEAWGALPSQNQYDYQKEELSAFCHFGMNTFTGSEWGNGEESPSQFNLTTKFDAETMVSSLKEAGFQKLIVTAKHHDGFCIWRSAYTDHDLESTVYEGDVLQEISAACTKYDMDMGLYLSPWDVNSPSYGYYDSNGNALCDNNGNPKDGMTWDEVYEKDALDYNEYYNNQLIEILGDPKYGNDGHFNEVWMDGAKGGGSAAQNYDFDLWFNTIQKYEGIEAGYESDCMLFGAEAHTTVRWIGNELGFANEETWSKSNVNFSNNTIDSNTKGGYTVGFPNGNQWTVPEADARITSGWFWGQNKKTPKTMEQLAEMYFRSVGHNATFLLNVPPNNQGKIDQDILDRVKEFGDAIKMSFSANYAAHENVSISASEVRGNDIAYAPENVLDGNDDTYWTMNDGSTVGSLEIDLGSARVFDVVSIEEAIQLGQRISSFRVEYKNGDDEWKDFSEGTTIGAKRLCRETPVKGDRVRISITGSHAVPLISEVGVYKTSEDFSIGSATPDVLNVVDNLDIDTDDGFGFEYTGWNQETGAGMMNGTGMWANAGAEATLKFNGTKAWLIGTTDPNHGTADIYIDGEKVTSIDTYADARSLGVQIYETPTLADGAHTLRVVNTNKAIGIQGAYVLDNGGKGMFELEHSRYTVEEDRVLEVLVRRVGGSTGEATVILQDNPGSAVQSEYYPTEGIRLEFEDGETEKRAEVRTKRQELATGDLFFYLEIVSDTQKPADMGFTSMAMVTILDADKETKETLAELVASTERMNPAHYVAGYDAMLEAAAAAQEVLDAVTSTGTSINIAYQALIKAIDEMVVRENYTEEDPFVFPVRAEDNGLLEAEFFNLVPIDTSKYVRITESASASNGKEINWFETGNKITLPFVAPKAGSYIVTATYRSGRSEESPNAFVWSGTNISSGEADVFGPDADIFKKVQFNIEIPKAGEGEWVFTADEKAGPVIDKFEIEYVPVPVEGIHFEQTEEIMYGTGKNLQLKATVLPAEADNQNIIWTTSDESIVRVSESGLVTSAGIGTAKITAATEEGGFKAECRIEVKAVPVTGITLNKLNIELNAAGAADQLSAVIAPSDATNKAVTWTSSNNGVATVDAGGKVTAVANGTANITAETKDGGFSAVAKVTVKISDKVQKPGRVTGVKTSSYTTKSFKVTWKKQEGADSYEVKLYNQQTKKWKSVGKTSNTSLVVKKLAAGAKYKVKVEASNRVGTGEASKAFSTATKPAQVKKLAVKRAGATKVRLTFKKVKGTGYQVAMKTGNGKFKPLKKIKKNSWTKSGLKSGKKYVFKVRSYVKNGSTVTYGAYSAPGSMK